MMNLFFLTLAIITIVAIAIRIIKQEEVSKEMFINLVIVLFIFILTLKIWH